MNVSEKIRMLEIRLHKVAVRDSNNHGVQRKIMREIRNLQKKLENHS